MTSIGVSLREWETLRPDPGSPLAGVSFSNDDESRRVAQLLSNSGQVEVLELAQGIAIRASSYVGRVTLGRLTITIRPKIDDAPLLRLLRHAYSLRDVHVFAETQFHTEGLTFQDLLIHLLVAEANGLLSRGLHRDYALLQANLASPRGRIAMDRMARQAVQVDATLPCSYFPRVLDHPLNRALLAGLGFAARLTFDAGLASSIHVLRKSLTESVPEQRLDARLLEDARLAMDRRTEAYRPALVLINLLKQSAGISLADDTSSVRGVSGFLFDMNRFFQALVLRLLRDFLTGCDVRSEQRIADMFGYDPDRNPRYRKAPVQRPDFIVEREGKVGAVLDAKYRDLWETQLPRDMLYQLAVYALSQPKELAVATIIYPTLAKSAQDQAILISEPRSSVRRAQVVLRPLNLLVLDGLLREKGPKAQRELQAWTRLLAFGRGDAVTARQGAVQI